MRPLSKWNIDVHTHCLATGQPITPMQAIERFGNPASRSSAASLLANAALAGYFRREEWLEEGSSKQVNRFRYVALEREVVAADPRSSYFTGLRRVRSVFDLGASL